MITFKIYHSDPSYKYPSTAQAHTTVDGFNTEFKTMTGIKRSIITFWDRDKNDYIAHIFKGADGICTADIELVK